MDTVPYESYAKERKNILDFFIVNDSKKRRFNNSEIIPLKYINKGVFKDPDYDVHLEFKEPTKGDRVSLTTHAHHQNKIYRHIKDSALWQPSKETVAQFTGKYYSKHLDYYWTIIQNEEGKLVIKRPTIADAEMAPDRKNEFLFQVEKYPDKQFQCMGTFS